MPNQPDFTKKTDESDFPNADQRAIEDALIAADPQGFVRDCMRGEQSVHSDSPSPSKEAEVLPPSNAWTR